MAYSFFLWKESVSYTHLHVVDVNSGNRIKNANGQEANALEVNLGAADEPVSYTHLDVYKRQVYDRRETITRGVRITWEAPLMRHFTVQLERL